MATCMEVMLLSGIFVDIFGGQNLGEMIPRSSELTPVMLLTRSYGPTHIHHYLT